jgi:polysaccharide export outer membrane protein
MRSDMSKRLLRQWLRAHLSFRSRGRESALSSRDISEKLRRFTSAATGTGISKHAGIFCALFAVLALVRVMAGGESPLSTNLPPATVSATTNVASSLPASLSGYVPDDKYKLRAGDKVAFQILEDRDAPKSLVVADSGELDAPYIGRVAAADKTCKQLADELKSQLEKEYYYRATVIVALDVANKFLGRIYVWGQVRNQGPLDLAVNENLTAGKAILRAGGFGDFANKKKVKVVRGAGPDGTGKQSFELNMVEILEEGKTEKDVQLLPDDFIIIPSRLINF